MVAPEQIFSIRKNTLDERRSSLRPKNLKVPCLLNDCSKVTSRTQHIKSDEEDQDKTEETSRTTMRGHASECD